MNNNVIIIPYKTIIVSVIENRKTVYKTVIQSAEWIIINNQNTIYKFTSNNQHDN